MSKRPNEVLLVDDDDAVRKMMMKVLLRAGLKVEAVSRASEALEILKRRRGIDYTRHRTALGRRALRPRTFASR